MSIGAPDDIEDIRPLDSEEETLLRGGGAGGTALRNRIAAPPSDDSRPPALSLRGLTPAPGAPAPALSPVAKRLGDEQSELSRLENTGSGISQIKNPWGRRALRGLNIAGELATSIFPAGYTALRAIPGTEEHHKALLGEQRRKIGEDLEAQSQELSAGKTQADTDEANARAALIQKQTEQAGQPKPKEENWGEFAGFTDTDGTPLIKEANSGQILRADHKPPTGFKAAKAAPDKPDTPAQQAFDGYIAQGLTPMQAFEKIREKLPTPGAEAGTWQLGEDKDGKPILWNSKTGAQRDAGGIQKPGTHEKATQAEAGEQQAINYAKDYIERGVFTGSGDEALQEKFFELAKPKTGFRMSQPQMDMLQNSRSWINSVEAHLRHTTTGTWFSPEQRQQIYTTMQQLADARQKPGGGVAASNEGAGGADSKPPREAAANMKWQHRTVNGKIEWREVPAE